MNRTDGAHVVNDLTKVFAGVIFLFLMACGTYKSLVNEKINSENLLGAASEAKAANVQNSFNNDAFAYFISQDCGSAAESMADQNLTTLRSFENAVELGTAQASHSDISSIGKGRFSHWEGAPVFSASDDSDPSTNGRKHTYTNGVDRSPKNETPVAREGRLSGPLVSGINPPYSVDYIFSVTPETLPARMPALGVDQPVNRYGFVLRRETDASQFPADDPVGSFGNTYSKLRSITLDNSHMVVGDYRILRRADSKIVGYSAGGTPRPSNTDTNLYFHTCPASGKRNGFCVTDIRDFSTKLLIEFPEFSSSSMNIGGWEGSQSKDDRYITVESDSHIVSLEIAANKSSAKEIGRLAKHATDHNWSGFSLSGEYIIVENNPPDYAYPKRFWIRYDKFLKNPATIAKSYQVEHSTFAVDDEGSDVIVSMKGNHVTYIRLRDAKSVQTGVTGNGYTAGYGHMSAAIHDPGYVYMARLRDDKNMIYRVALGAVPGGAVFTDDSGFQSYPGIQKAWVYGEVWSTSEHYGTMPMPSVNAYGDMVVFRSDWNGAIEKSVGFTLRLE